MCHRAGVPLVANDRPDLAILAGCDLVHVGQDDMPIDRVRRIAPGLGVGVSTHTLEQLDAALAARPDVRRVRPGLRDHDEEEPRASRRARRGCARPTHGRSAAGIPLVAIGGITYERARALVASADAVAVIAELLPPPRGRCRDPPDALRSTGDVLSDVVARARALKRLVRARPRLRGAPCELWPSRRSSSQEASSSAGSSRRVAAQAQEPRRTSARRAALFRDDRTTRSSADPLDGLRVQAR